MFYLTKDLGRRLTVSTVYMQLKFLDSDREKCHDDKYTTIAPISSADIPQNCIPGLLYSVERIAH